MTVRKLDEATTDFPLSDLADVQFDLVEGPCFACSGKGATGPGTEKACCSMHQPIGLIVCGECNGTGKTMFPKLREPRDSEAK